MSKPFQPPSFIDEAAQQRYFERYGTWEVHQEQCLTCATCNEPIYPGTPIAHGPVHRTFECSPPGMGGWTVHDPVKQ